MPAIKETEQKTPQVETKAQTEETKNSDVPTKPKYSKEELLRIFDEIIFSSEYVEDVTLRGKLKVSFKTRTAEETTTISREIDGLQFTLLSTLSEFRALKNLAYSMVKYSGKDLGNMSVEERLKFVNKLPAPVVSLLSDALIKFDTKIMEACQEGEANF